MLLQETHIKDEEIIKLYWRGGYVSSCISTNIAGVIILFKNGYECIKKSIDAGGRFASVVLESKLVESSASPPPTPGSSSAVSCSPVGYRFGGAGLGFGTTGKLGRVLCILTSFRVLAAPESWSKHIFKLEGTIH